MKARAAIGSIASSSRRLLLESPSSRWILGALPAAAGLTFLSWSTLPFQALYLVAGWTSVAAFALSLGPRPGSARSRLVLAGACACGGLLAVPWALLGSYLVARAVGITLIELLDGNLSALAVFMGFFAPLTVLLTIAPCIHFLLRSVGLRRRAWDGEASRSAGLAMLLGFLLPLLVGGCAEFGLRRIERTIIERFVLAPVPDDPESLTAWRPVAGLHPWPVLWELTEHDASATAPPLDERARRARAAFEALTGFDFSADSRTGD